MAKEPVSTATTDAPAKAVVPVFTPIADFVTEALNEHGTIKDDKGKVAVYVPGLVALAEDNHLAVKDYPNPGMARMNIANMLRAAARRRGGLFIAGAWVNAPEGYSDKAPTENPDGTKIPKAPKAPKAPKEDAA